MVIELVSVLVIGCGGGQEKPATPVASDLDVDPEPDPDPDPDPDPVSDHDHDHDDDHELELEVEHDHERPRRWRGIPIDLDVKQADLHNVFRLLAEVGDVSIVVADDVRGEVTLRLRSVPWDQALDTVVRLEKLSMRRDGTVYTISRSSSSASSSASAPP